MHCNNSCMEEEVIIKVHVHVDLAVVNGIFHPAIILRCTEQDSPGTTNIHCIFQVPMALLHVYQDSNALAKFEFLLGCD